MSKVSVRQPHTLGRAAAKAKLASFEEMLAKYKVKLAWNGDSATVQGLGVSGTVDVRDDHVEVGVSLGFLAKAAGVDATKLQSSITKRLLEALG